MVETLLYLSGLAVIVIGVCIAFAARRAYREAKQGQEKLKWATEQLETAIDQINSDDDIVILAGLQTLSMLNMPDVRLKALGRLTELLRSPNPLIVKLAEANIQKVTISVSAG
jgi:hypothetical protein